MDLKIEMGYCSHYQIQKMYSSVMRNAEAQINQAFLDGYVPEGLLPPCEVMTCFVLYRRTPKVIPEMLSQLVSKFKTTDAPSAENLLTEAVLPEKTDLGSKIPAMDSGYSSDS
ncbi:hypothetical protein K493DRAFT_303598 [Basidiobolus meristosporus CBS 931.73]|uniref:Uncharacterized protein n=1 Tax=Basidiobolus meristosporus CBS 931.73 TaxID=1314790 RepID=A0A1Y1Y279_9FUNG|nr:hypothetical protein K493DRAFT_303598 [Basidiobolus meristosporus CBS 931.73]|eukprot:ORX92088.1 hypothetical protein K493DRAFT_303598 [Basidiobolus meristosporus CBS 931.73]